MCVINTRHCGICPKNHCFPHGGAVVGGEDGHGYYRIFSSFLSYFSLTTSLSTASSSFYLLLLLVLYSQPKFSRSLLTQSSHRNLGFPLSGHLIFVPVCQFFTSHSFHMTGPFQPTAHQFVLKPFHHSILHSQFTHSSLICSLHSHNSSTDHCCICPESLFISELSRKRKAFWRSIRTVLTQPVATEIKNITLVV